MFGIIFIALAVWIAWGISNRGKADMVVVYQDGREISRHLLMGNETIAIPFDGEGYNLLMISNGKASVSDADCPDRLCVSQRTISHKGECIICLPHKLVITIDSDQEGELDAVTY